MALLCRPVLAFHDEAAELMFNHLTLYAYDRMKPELDNVDTNAHITLVCDDQCAVRMETGMTSPKHCVIEDT